MEVTVRHKPTGKIGMIPQDKFDPNLFEMVGQQQPQAQMQQPQMGQTAPQTYTPITGRTIQQHSQALQKAQQMGDQNAIKQIQDAYDREYKYMQDFGQEEELTATEKKNLDSYNSITNFINNLERHYQAAKGGEVQGPLGGVVGLQKSIAGNIGLNDPAKIYNSERRGFTATLRSLTGDTGVLTEADYQRIAELLPKLGSNPEVATSLFNDLRSSLAAKFGGGVQKTSISPQTYSKGSGTVLMDMLLGDSLNVAKDVGAGISANQSAVGRKQSVDRSMKQAEMMIQQAQKTSDPQLKQELFRRAQDVYSGVSQNEREVASTFSEDVGENPFIRGLNLGQEVTTLAGIPGFLKGAYKTGAKAIHPFRSVGEMKQAAVAQAQGKSLSGDQMFAALEKARKTISPTDIKSYDAFLASAKPALQGKQIPIETAVQLQQHANSAFTAAGKVGKSSKAVFNKILGDSIRGQIKVAAPKIAEANKLFEYLYGAQGFAKKAVLPAAISAGVGIPLYALFSRLGVSKGQR